MIACKHGCGFKFDPKEEVDGQPSRKLRDQFDYHEQQKCPLLPRLVCPLECVYRGKVLSFAGPKALRQHLKTKAHKEAVEKSNLHGTPLPAPKLVAEFEPALVHGNPKEVGFRKPPGQKTRAVQKREKKAAKPPKRKAKSEGSSEEKSEKEMSKFLRKKQSVERISQRKKRIVLEEENMTLQLESLRRKERIEFLAQIHTKLPKLTQFAEETLPAKEAYKRLLNIEQQATAARNAKSLMLSLYEEKMREEEE